MEDDDRVWPPGSEPRHRRTSRDDDADAPWNPTLRRTTEKSSRAEEERLPWESMPPSARFYGAPADPGKARRLRGRRWRRRGTALLALVVAGGLVAGLATLILRVAEPAPYDGTLTDATAGIGFPLPPGWREEGVPPATGFTSAARLGREALVMARPVAGVPADLGRATSEAAELYSRLLLNGDTVTTVEDKTVTVGPLAGHSRSLRADYRDVVNRPAYLRVMLLTRGGRSVLLVGVAQPDETARRRALDAVMASVR